MPSTRKPPAKPKQTHPWRVHTPKLNVPTDREHEDSRVPYQANPLRRRILR